MDNSLLACKCLIELVSGVFAQLVLAMVFKTIGGGNKRASEGIFIPS
jgi:hypothetical protein